MREDFDPVVADRFKVLDQAPVPDTWSRVQFELLDPTSARFTEQDAVNGTDYLAALRARSTTVTLIDTEPTPTPTDGRHRWPIVTVAAAAVVALGVGALMLAARDDSEPQGPADTIVNTTDRPRHGNSRRGGRSRLPRRLCRQRRRPGTHLPHRRRDRGRGLGRVGGVGIGRGVASDTRLECGVWVQA